MKAMLEACLEKMEANPGEMKSIVVNRKVRDEEAMVEMIGATEDRTRYCAILHIVRAAIIKDRRSRRDDGRAWNATVE
jgi:hypothetical protein